eukprot:jgi/Astpho2/3017/fgenesh1_pg.00051_%23_34_t
MLHLQASAATALQQLANLAGTAQASSLQSLAGQQPGMVGQQLQRALAAAPTSMAQALQQQAVQQHQRPAQPAMANHLHRQLHQQQQPRVGRPPGSGAAMAASQVMARAQLHRGPGRPPSRPYAAQTTTAGSQAAIHAAVVQQQHINRQMTRGPNQRVDKPQATPLLPESRSFSVLQKREREVDELVARKRRAIREAGHDARLQNKKLRVSVHSQAMNQPKASGQRGSGKACRSMNVGACIADAPSWVLTLHGGLLDPAQASQLPPLGFQPQPADAFQWFVRKLTVQLDPALYPGPDGVIQWEKAQHVGEWRDKFEIRRQGSSDVHVDILIELDQAHPTCKLDSALAKVAGFERGTRPGAVAAVYDYIRKHGLQSAQDPGTVTCNPELEAALQQKVVKMAALPALVGSHCHTEPPPRFSHTVRMMTDQQRVGGQHLTGTTEWYDINIAVPMAGTPDPYFLTTMPGLDKDLAALDKSLWEVVNLLQEQKRRRALLLGFSRSPVDFIQSMVATQGRELRSLKLNQYTELEAVRRSDLFRGKWVEEAALRHLQAMAPQLPPQQRGQMLAAEHLRLLLVLPTVHHPCQLLGD